MKGHNQLYDKKQRRIDELEQQVDHYRHVINGLKLVVFQTNAAGDWIFLNPAWEELTEFSIDESLGKPFLDFIFPADKGKNERKFMPLVNKQKDHCRHEIRYLKKSGSYLWVEVYARLTLDNEGRATGTTGTLTDISTKHLLEKEIQRTQKLESLGLLAAGIAHDFNNLLTTIQANLSFADELIPNNHINSINHISLEACLSSALKASNSAKDLTQQLLTFAKGGTPVLAFTDIATVVKEATQFSLRGSVVSVEYTFPSSLPMIKLDAGQLSQAIHNITLNAVEAMPSGGKIHVELAYDANTRVHDDSTQLGCLRISIRDNGIGMHFNTLDHLFDPYFSTKKRGSGLGLTIVHSIVEQHNGRVLVDSKMGKGTTITLLLPGIAHSIITEKNGKAHFPHSAGKVLIMDDEAAILEVLKLMLEHLNFEVETATNGEIALEKYQNSLNRNTPFDLLISDLTIANGMGGLETLRVLKQLNPNILAIVASGYSNDPILASPTTYGFCGVLEKPYTFENVKQALQLTLKTEHKQIEVELS